MASAKPGSLLPSLLKSMRLEAMAMVSASSVSSSDLSCFKISMNSFPQLLGPGPSRPRSSKRMSRTKASGPSSSSRPPLKGRNSRNLRTTSSAVLLLLLHRLTTNSRSGKKPAKACKEFITYRKTIMIQGIQSFLQHPALNCPGYPVM